MAIVRIGTRVFQFPSVAEANGFEEGIRQGESIEVCLAMFNGVEITPKQTVKEPPPKKTPPKPEDNPPEESESPSP